MTSHSNSPSAQQSDPASSEVCSTKEAASLLGVSHRTVQLWVESGVLQAWKTAGGHRRILLSSVHRLVAQRNQAVSANAPAAAAPEPEAAAGRRIVMADDDATLLRLYELEISGWGLDAELIKARDGFDALIRIGEARPHLLISDLNMPGMDGFRMVRTLRADPRYGKMAIVVISGLDRATIASMGLPEDIPVFSKPVRFAELRKTVEQIFGAGAEAGEQQSG
ncbi:response regulator [Massilia sp. YIM B02443]|uniref:response regulator n=1 Tax=Massilia sp. YIM B02443 TaxID=3050127 RepID=UPI0025B664DB|nr:response regulator [Massilia sp. YIM B02443]MDN4037732.1 response regulator [Massilia sp. YIM B02443]